MESPQDTESASRWCVARTAASKENWALTNLLLRGHSVYLPLCTVRRRDRLRHSLITVRAPLFRNYLFVEHTSGDSWRPIRSAPGVESLIIVGGRLQYAPEGLVEHLQATEGLRQSPDAPKHLYRPGAACRLNSGPFRDHDAVVAAIEGDNVVVSIMLFGELRRVAVPLDSLSPRED